MRSFVFKNMDEFKAAWPQVSESLKSYFDASKSVQIDHKLPSRSSFDNRKLHAALSPIHKQAIFDIRHNGIKQRVYCKEFDFETFKTFAVAYFCEDMKAMGEQLKPGHGMREEVNPFTGERTKIRPSTTVWPKEVVGLFCHCMRAWAAESIVDVVFDQKSLAVYEEYKEMQAAPKA